jgi:hypothetical protein
MATTARQQAPSPLLVVGLAASSLAARQAVARPSEVDDWRQTTANVEASTRRSAAVWPAAGQLAISWRHIYDI